jgi:hypothetical protein
MHVGHLRILTAVALAILLIHACRVLADDSGVYAVGGAIRAMEQVPGITLEAEFVRGYAFPKEDSIYVECVFYLHNEGAARNILIGFPEESWGDVGKGRPFTFFKSYVNGQEVSVSRSSQPDSTLAAHTYRHWWTKTVAFAAGENKVIRNVYASTPGGTSDGSNWLCYTLWTGASWDHPIGSADVVLTVVDPRGSYHISATPGGYSRGENEFRWHLREFEPTRSDSLAEIFVSWKKSQQ